MTHRGYDVFVYHDLSDSTGTTLAIGDDAAKLAAPGKWIVALGPPIHDGKDATIVLGDDPRPMTDVQKLLERR